MPCYFNPHSRTGSDPAVSGCIPCQSYFNPHSRTGSDREALESRYLKGISIHTPARGVTRRDRGRGKAGAISIHTPARGVTPAEAGTLRRYGYFNPHSRTGSDTTGKTTGIRLIRFQSTLPHGE